MENAADLTQSLGKLVHDYNTRERQLIEEMRISNKGQAVNLEYEDLEGYEVPPRTQFCISVGKDIIRSLGRPSLEVTILPSTL